MRMLMYLASIFMTTLLLGCATLPDIENLTPGRLFASLPDTCPTPDALVATAQGDVLLSCPNFASKTQPGTLLRLSSDGEVEDLGQVPGLVTTAQPMGMAFDESGNLYIANNEAGGNGNILKVQFQNGQIVGSQIVAKGFSSPNGLRYRDGFLYVTQLQMPKATSGDMVSGLYRIPTEARGLEIASDLSDSELIFYDTTANPKRQFGLDGLVFDDQGALYLTNFGDGKVYRLILSEAGEVLQSSVFAELSSEVGLDGISIDTAGNLYVAGFLLNQVYRISPDAKVSLIADYPDNQGADGAIDQPADLMVFGDQLLISNFDLMKGEGVRNSAHTKPYTISTIPLN
ncbi:SMP-30/gluconolactonase/LRE family protein [Gilvimarinus agarilyticus]|uniref:SMP-30/gluconolactonase/LRE family protein n=1 Tax=Gilvimarinus sp. 2_MG-2023 TaxID=3062666 RepID=UPI001C09B2FB|nr:SMP-30/gluconolactonase/LRE family protein [Gilvimarinus sp. 2_MG-2023]MBU2886382.1 SMP-30/gluconolactonase/LRE family protein [Gilvimarinus agarilyticus]MDO6571061.1 SMP-30/gluconolactonase/LRE family protein [Gilvimarinus sp. 2_MG-2023]